MATVQMIEPVTVSLSDLKSNSVPFSSLLEAFGPDSLGILVVKGLPATFTSLRSQVLANSSRLAALPTSKLDTLTKESAKYLVGWSHGKETLRPGVVDTFKGSYYINCAFYKDPSLQAPRDGDKKFPGFEEYTAPNVWPFDEDIQGFRTSAEDLIRLIIDTAILVARACDKHAEQEIDDYTPGHLERMVQNSEVTKARLLHYFPSNNKNKHAEGAPATNGHTASTAAATSPQTDGHSTSDQRSTKTTEPAEDDWCATHVDHGCLTGLTSAMFLDESSSDPFSELLRSPSPSSGLYIRDRHGKTHKVSIPRDCLAFQTGEALELITQGKFKAVPHFVRGVDVQECEDSSARIARNTLAVFTQPNLDEVVDTRSGLTFGEFARGVVKKNTVG